MVSHLFQTVDFAEALEAEDARELDEREGAAFVDVAGGELLFDESKGILQLRFEGHAKPLRKSTGFQKRKLRRRID
jgi:hypothetical protein